MTDKIIYEIREWGREKGILKHSTPQDQFIKTVEEVGEIAAGLARGDKKQIMDSIGDVGVTLVLLAELCGMTFQECLEYAYNEIKGRTGKMQNGVFVKDCK